jgi:hypothetical protein
MVKKRWVYRGTLYMVSLRAFVKDIDLAFGLVLSLCLGFIVGFVIDHHLGHLMFSSAVGATLVLIYLVSYSLSAIWMVGLPQGLVVVAVFVWSIILGSAL